MSSGYNPKSCNALEKSFYRPVEAALRWCGLIEHESEILAALHGGADTPSAGQFPRWPCLRANTERIIDAIRHSNIPYGRDGKTVPDGEHVRPDRVTVRHTDLREWMAKTYPDQKPDFLFDEIERNTHAAINADSFRALQADRDSLKARIEKAEDWARSMIAEKKALEGRLDSLRAREETVSQPLDPRSERTYQTIIGAMLELLVGEDKPYKKQSALVAELVEKNKRGMSERTLNEKLPECRDIYKGN